jgi:hypothetical protein
MEVKNEPHQYQWIINEGLLRDEGTLFGIAGAAIGDKIDAIRDYYRIRKAAARTKRELLDKKVETVRGETAKSLTEKEEVEAKISSVNLVPLVLQVLLYAAICYFNFFLIIYWLTPTIHSFFICLGLYLFGLFSVFVGRSILYNAAAALNGEVADSSSRERWKIYFEELGVPLVVSLFIAILPSTNYPLRFSVIAALLLFLLFLLSGKGLVNTIFRTREEVGRLAVRARRRRIHRRNLVRLDAVQEEWRQAAAELEELDGEEAYKIRILTSEYQLAFESRQLASGHPAKKPA